MTTWSASVGEILDVLAEALICSANPQLNLSGGVGGELLRRYGPAMQQYLRDWLQQSSQAHVAPGTVVVAPSSGSPYRFVLHAVAVDAFYDTSAEIITQALEVALTEASRRGCRTVVSACLGCGYGRAKPELFALAVRPLMGRTLPGVERVEFRSRDAEVIEAVRQAITAGIETPPSDR